VRRGEIGWLAITDDVVWARMQRSREMGNFELQLAACLLRKTEAVLEP
jgi:hypothetical protein